MQRVLAASPEISAAQAAAECARLAVDRARAEPIPNVDFQFTAEHDNATRDNIVGVQAVLPIPIWNRNQGGIIKHKLNLPPPTAMFCECNCPSNSDWQPPMNDTRTRGSKSSVPKRHLARCAVVDRFGELSVPAK